METPEIKAISKANVHMICSAQVFINYHLLPRRVIALVLQVILSPAIALKELLENAIDARATNVEIKLVDMGARSISVADNGSGVKERDFQALSEYLSVSIYIYNEFIATYFCSCQASHVKAV